MYHGYGKILVTQTEGLMKNFDDHTTCPYGAISPTQRSSYDYGEVFKWDCSPYSAS